jgi:FdhD protein
VTFGVALLHQALYWEENKRRDMAKIIAVSRSKKRGVKKEVIPEGILRENYGLVGDVHATLSTQRQVSLLAAESIRKMRRSGVDLGPGDFAENLTCEGINLASLALGTQLVIGEEIVLEITQIGKECHSGCAVSRKVGSCLMPREGVFARVIRGGAVKAGDEIRVLSEKLTNTTEMLSVESVTEEGKQDARDLVTRELPLAIILNNRELATLLCSPLDLGYLAIGFLFSKGLIGSRDEVRKIVVDDRKGVVRVETGEGKERADRLPAKRLMTSGTDAPGRGKVTSRFRASAAQVLALVRQFQGKSQIFRATGGVHSAALCDQRDILVFSEDISRHSAIDKVWGRCIWDNIATANRVLITSGRVSSEIVLKVARMNIPILVSRSAPTDLGVRLAADLGVTLVGFARGGRMTVYTKGWRIIAGGK